MIALYPPPEVGGFTARSDKQATKPQSKDWGFYYPKESDMASLFLPQTFKRRGMPSAIALRKKAKSR